jgi:hypothetical protein
VAIALRIHRIHRTSFQNEVRTEGCDVGTRTKEQKEANRQSHHQHVSVGISIVEQRTATLQVCLDCTFYATSQSKAVMVQAAAF